MTRTRRRHRVIDDEAEEDNTIKDRYPSYSPEPFNILKETLDSGGLTTRSIDREFTNFLDLKDRYHKEFMDTLQRHAQEGGYSIQSLTTDALEQRLCAMDFLDKYGEMYWGTQGKREKYLKPDRLARPDELAVYPLREEEIARALIILIEKKAKKGWRNTEKSGQATEAMEDRNLSRLSLRTPAARSRSSPASSAGSDIPFLPIDGTANTEKGKRRSTRPESSALSEVTPDLTNLESRTNKKRKIRNASSSNEAVLPDVSNLEIGKSDLLLNRAPARNLTSIERAHYEETYFMVSASTQKDMAPVWVDYQRFDSATAFIDAMASECLAEWDPSAQLRSEILGMSNVLAASVRFGWTDFSMRVRLGRDEDWERVMKRLEQAWEDRDRDPEGAQGGRFRVEVMVHVSG